ncbi:MAG: aminopeptidase P family protein [Pseudomonadota bacterium]
MEMSQRLDALRRELKSCSLEGFLVPRVDEHQGEYVPPQAQRLSWLTGFTGSAGMAAVLLDRAAVFVDGRYTLQVRDEVDPDLFEFRHITDEPLSAWLAENLQQGAKLAYDPWLHSKNGVKALEQAVAAVGATLYPTKSNPLDAVWMDQPARPSAAISLHPLDYAGKPAAEKRQDMASRLQEKKADAAVLTLPDSIAWLLNVRGADVDCTPFALSFAILYEDGRVDWFIDPKKLDRVNQAELAAHLGDGVSSQRPEALVPALRALTGKKVMLDPGSAPVRLHQILDEAGAQVMNAPDPCQLPKAQKNSVELDGARAAHRRDGAALTRFLAWLDKEGPGRAADGGLKESEAADHLAGLRREDNLFRDQSFETIAGSGPNGAIVHYRVSPASDRKLGLGELFLCDSGGQFLDGTTDVTRTVPVGEPSEDMAEKFTLVLQGHIALGTARFPKGTTGSQLDVLARQFLWQRGLDYDHGTGHGVGSYLSVHEGPQRISKVPNSVALAPGMIVSNEPGYYKTGAFGIRIENLVAVVESPARPGEEREMLEFETLTLAPLSRRLIKVDMLSPTEIAWVDAYHARVRKTHEKALTGGDRVWLIEATEPFSG